MLSPQHLEYLFQGLNEIWPLDKLAECSFEANPATFGTVKAQLMRDLGINRVSLGIQSFDDQILKTLGREHQRHQAIQAVETLQEVGIPQVNIDLMFSIPGQSLGSWQDTLETAISLNPNHISAYNLTYEEDTAFFESLKKGDYQLDQDKDAEHYEYAKQRLKEAGFEQYETSNYAKNKAYSIHNQAYWFGNDYIGLGPSAVSTIQQQRHENVADTAQYMERIRKLSNAIQQSEPITAEAHLIERVALELRTKRGLKVQHTQKINQEVLRQYLSNHTLQKNEGYLRINPERNAFVDHIVSELL